MSGKGTETKQKRRSAGGEKSDEGSKRCSKVERLEKDAELEFFSGERDLNLCISTRKEKWKALLGELRKKERVCVLERERERTQHNSNKCTKTVVDLLTSHWHFSPPSLDLD